jgi:hypothetical protein
MAEALLTDQEFYDVIKDTPHIKESTKHPYKYVMNNIKRYAGGNTSLNDIFMDADKYYVLIRNEAFEKRQLYNNERSPYGPLTTFQTILKTVVSVIKYSGMKATHPYVHSRWFHYVGVVGRELDGLKDLNMAIQYMEWGDVLARLKWLSEKSYGSIEHVTLAMYTLIPPRRNYDYWKLATDPQYDGDGCTGVLDLNTEPATITIKASKQPPDERCDVYNAELPDELVNIIRTYLGKKAAKKTTKYTGLLFSKINGQPYGVPTAFADSNNRVIKRVLCNPTASVNILRGSFATHVNRSPDLSREQRKAIADAMAHSLASQKTYVSAPKA